MKDHISNCDESKLKRMEIIVSKRAQLAINSYSSLVTDMVQLLKVSNLHWRFCGMALNFLGLILCDQQPVPAELTAYVVETIVNEHPSLRKSCIALAIRIFVVQKRRARLRGTDNIQQLTKSIVLDSMDAEHFKKSFVSWFKQDNIFSEIP